MKVRMVAMGKTSEKYLKAGIENYLSRLKHYIDFEIIELNEIKGSKKMNMDQYRQKEANVLLPVLTSDYTILLDEKGKSYTSFGFAKFLNRRMVSGLKSIDFVVGGPFGFDQSLRERCDDSLSLSDMTFSHQMIRLFFIEQVYRAMTIIRGEKYHHS